MWRWWRHCKQNRFNFQSFFLGLFLWNSVASRGRLSHPGGPSLLLCFPGPVRAYKQLQYPDWSDQWPFRFSDAAAGISSTVSDDKLGITNCQYSDSDTVGAVREWFNYTKNRNNPAYQLLWTRLLIQMFADIHTFTVLAQGGSTPVPIYFGTTLFDLLRCKHIFIQRKIVFGALTCISKRRCCSHHQRQRGDPPWW